MTLLTDVFHFQVYLGFPERHKTNFTGSYVALTMSVHQR